MDKHDLHRLIDQLPDRQTDEAARLLVALLRQSAPATASEDLMTAEDRAWLDAGMADLVSALAEVEADVPPEELRAWFAAFEDKARPCVYVPGQGFVAKQ